jgi:hypothetical protein
MEVTVMIRELITRIARWFGRERRANPDQIICPSLKELRASNKADVERQMIQKCINAVLEIVRLDVVNFAEVTEVWIDTNRFNFTVRSNALKAFKEAGYVITEIRKPTERDQVYWLFQFPLEDQSRIRS